MRQSHRLARVCAIPVISLLPLSAIAADPPDANLLPSTNYDDGIPGTILAQAAPQTVSPTGAGPANGSASGISSNPSNDTTGQLASRSIPLPTSAPPLTGLFPSVGETLLGMGIDVHGIAFDHFLANPTAGNVPGQTYNLGVLSPTIDFDLYKLLGIPGANIHTQVTLFGLRSNIPNIITDIGGFLDGYQTTPDPDTASIVLSMLTYEQKFLNGDLSIEGGRTNVYQYFLLPNGLDIFNEPSSTFSVDGDFNANPFPTWGGRITYHMTPKWYVQGGAFDDDYFRAVFNPDNFGLDGSSGAQILGEVGYRSEFDNAKFPANLEAGFEWNTRHGVYNVKGSALLATPFNQATDYRGGGLVFFQGEQVLWRGSRQPFGPPANIALWGSADASVDKPQPIDMDATIGVNLTGLIPRRPFDALGISAHYQRLSAFETNYETEIQNIFAGPGRRQPRDNYSFEVIANLVLAPWLELDPLVQYYVNPDNLFNPAQTRRPSDGFIAGAFAIVPLGHLLGTSGKPF